MLEAVAGDGGGGGAENRDVQGIFLKVAAADEASQGMAGSDPRTRPLVEVRKTGWVEDTNGLISNVSREAENSGTWVRGKPSQSRNVPKKGAPDTRPYGRTPSLRRTIAISVPSRTPPPPAKNSR